MKMMISFFIVASSPVYILRSPVRVLEKNVSSLLFTTDDVDGSIIHHMNDKQPSHRRRESLFSSYRTTF